jgi:hypothetical protein
MNDGGCVNTHGIADARLVPMLDNCLPSITKSLLPVERRLQSPSRDVVLID